MTVDEQLTATPQPAADAPTVTEPRDTFYVRKGKRVFDLVVAIPVMLLLLPLFATVAILGLCLLGRPLIFWQERVGREGGPFSMLKFRSMKHDRRVTPSEIGPDDRRRTHKSVNDPRHTMYGRIIRKTSIDELPQLWNVVRGDMSLVGPRPELPEIASRYGLIEHPRHTVRPGLTGLWQISNDRPGFVHENVKYDEEYLRSVSFFTDIKILLKTIPVLLRGGGL